jgi:glycosidase
VKQTPWLDNWNGTAYHGYWASDFYEVDPNFGTPEDLHTLVDTAHELEMLFMLDIVANHVGPLHTLDDVMNLGPGLNDPMGAQFHQDPHPDAVPFADYLLDPLTMMEAGPECWPYYTFGPDTCDFTTILDGWFGDLGDLNHENPDVQTYLLDWIDYMRST